MTFNFCYHGVSDCTALFRFDPTIGQDMLAVLQMKGPRINNNASLNDVVDNGVPVFAHHFEFVMAGNVRQDVVDVIDGRKVVVNHGLIVEAPALSNVLDKLRYFFIIIVRIEVST